MRIALSLAALLMGSAAALAQDIVIRADIAQATVFLSGAEVTRRADVTIPAGEHQLFIALPDADFAETISVHATAGLILGQPVLMPNHPLTKGALDDPAQAAARLAIDTAQQALEAALDALALADGAIRAIEMQLGYLSALSGDGSASADPAVLARLLATLGAETVRLEGELQAARIARRAPAQAVNDREAELGLAREALAKLSPFGTSVDMVMVSVTTPEATEGEITLDYFTHAANWGPSHELRLNSETGQLDLARFVNVRAQAPAHWQNVAMRFSTSEPQRRREPSVLWPTPARIMEPIAAPRLSGDMAFDQPGIMAAAAPAEIRAAVAIEGLSISFDYNTPVSIGESGEAVLPLTPLTVRSETEIRAVPRMDQTAFLVALFQNESGAPIMPGPARFFRDGALIGEDYLPLIPVGAEAELGFGPLDHLPLIWIDRSLAEGARGLFTTTNTQSRQIAFGVENLSDRPQTVRLLYATPFAEQEDLTLRVRLTPEPTARDIDDQRGVHEWRLELAPSTQTLIEMTANFDWPEGQLLLWQP